MVKRLFWDIKTARRGEEDKYLGQGYEPFAVSPQDTSYRFLNTRTGDEEIKYQTTDIIYLRKSWEEVSNG